jgi:hypothetical protein
MSKSGPKRRLGTLLLLVHLSGCKTMQPVREPPATFLTTEAPTRIQVRTVRGEEITLMDPRIEGDLIVGEIRDQRNRRSGVEWRAPVSDVTEVRVPQNDAALTLFVVVLVVPAVWLAAAVVACSDDRCS